MKIEYNTKELVIRIPIPADLTSLPKSKSGKSLMIATTGGNVPVLGAPEDFRLGLSFYAKAKAE